MGTLTYYPKDAPVFNLGQFHWSVGDRTKARNRAACHEGPSYCVLLVGLTYGDF